MEPDVVECQDAVERLRVGGRVREVVIGSIVFVVAALPAAQVQQLRGQYREMDASHEETPTGFERQCGDLPPLRVSLEEPAVLLPAVLLRAQAEVPAVCGGTNRSS